MTPMKLRKRVKELLERNSQIPTDERIRRLEVFSDDIEDRLKYGNGPQRECAREQAELLAALKHISAGGEVR